MEVVRAFGPEKYLKRWQMMWTIAGQRGRVGYITVCRRGIEIDFLEVRDSGGTQGRAPKG